MSFLLGLTLPDAKPSDSKSQCRRRKQRRTVSDSEADRPPYRTARLVGATGARPTVTAVCTVRNRSQKNTDMSHRSKSATWEKFPIKVPSQEESQSLVTYEENSKIVNGNGGNFRFDHSVGGDITLTINQNALRKTQKPFFVSCNVYGSRRECLENMDENSGIRSFMVKDKAEFLRSFEASIGDNKPLERGSFSPENWEMVVEVHGDQNAPALFSDYVEMKFLHNIKDKTKLSNVEIYCYRELSTGMKTKERIPNLATVLVDNPDAYYIIDHTHITLFTKHFCWYECLMKHGTNLSVEAWIFPLYHYQDDYKRQTLDLKVFLTDPGETVETITSKLKHKLDKGTLLTDGIQSETINLPDEYLNVKGKVTFNLAIQTGDAWKPFSINGEIVKPLKHKTQLGQIVECSQCATRKGCPPDAAIFKLQRSVPDGASRISRFEGSLLVTIKPLVTQGRRFGRFLSRWCLSWIMPVGGEEGEGEKDDGDLESRLQLEGITRIGIDVALPGEYQAQHAEAHPRDSAIGESLKDSDVDPLELNDQCQGHIKELKSQRSTNPDHPEESSSSKLDDHFLKWCTGQVITNDNNLHGFFLALDRKLFTGGKIDAAKHNAGNVIQMTGYNLARQWNEVCKDTDEVKLDKICEALKEIGKDSNEVRFREYFQNHS